MKKSVIKVWDKIIVMLLGMTGMFVGCNKIESDCDCVYYPTNERDTGEYIVELYGVPPAHYVTIKGTVMNQANLQPIANIRVASNGAISLTNSEGKYVLDYDYYQSNKKNVVNLKIEDIDGKENGGEFKTKAIDIKFTDTDKKKMDKCSKDGGRFVKIQNIELKKK